MESSFQGQHRIWYCSTPPLARPVARVLHSVPAEQCHHSGRLVALLVTSPILPAAGLVRQKQPVTPGWPRATQRSSAGHGTGEGLGPPGGVGNLHPPNVCASAGGTQHPYACASAGGAQHPLHTSAPPKRDIAPALEGFNGTQGSRLASSQASEAVIPGTSWKHALRPWHSSGKPQQAQNFHP